MPESKIGKRETLLHVTEWYGEHDGGLGDHTVVVARTQEDDPAAEWTSEPLAYIGELDPYDAEVQAAVHTSILETNWPLDVAAPRTDPYVIRTDDGEVVRQR